MLILSQGSYAQVQRTSTSVDIQVCVNGALATQRAAVQSAVSSQLQSMLSSTAVYFDSSFTDLSHNMCYLFVYQAPNDQAASQAFVYLNPSGASVMTMYMQVGNAVMNGTISAAQWTGESEEALGVPLPLQWSVNDLLLWGSCIVGGLVLCGGIACFYALYLTGKREAEEAEALLHADAQIIKTLKTLKNHKRKNHAEADDDDSS